MDAARWEHVKELFHAALRDRRVLEGAPGDVRDEVEALLRAHADAPADVPGEDAGATVGRYKLLRRLGEGGFGIVWMAEQTEPVRRNVALKILKAGMDTGQVAARFEAERQALALMDHPCIAKVLDAGATRSGRPYFVMDLVKGIPITQYCDEARLDTRARLDLFVQVCLAVQHAHQKGVIHRDLKPSNLLVSLDDGRPLPRIIDFGIAKATDQRLTERTLFTEFRQMIGTPDYMAPEQAEMSGLDVDTRADIYSLGVLLYELLTGTRPFDLNAVLQKGYEEILRTIREVDPPRPSNRVSTMGESLTPVAASRRTAPRLLGRLLRGDLDWIVMKALAKERGRRYETANAFASDIRRYLADEPVLAGPPRTLDRVCKYMRRHRVGATAAFLTAATLVAGVVLALGGYVDAAEQRDLARELWEEAALEAEAAERASTYEAEQRALADGREKEARTRAAQANVVLDLVREMLSPADPHQAKDPDLTVRELLDAFDRDLGNRLKEEPEVEAAIRATIGRAYLGLSLPDRAEPHLRAVLEIRGRMGKDNVAFANALAAWADFQHDIGQYAAARQTDTRVLEIRRRLLAPAAPEIADSLGSLCDLATHDARHDEAERLARERLELARARANDHHRLALALNGLARLMIAKGDVAAADALSAEALAITRASLGERHPMVGTCLYCRADVAHSKGDLGGAETLVRECLSICREAYGDADPSMAGGLTLLATLLNERGDRAAAESAAAESLAVARRAFGEDHPRLAQSLRNLATLLYQGLDDAGAEPLLREAVAIQRTALRRDHPDLGRTLFDLARVLHARGNQPEAEALAREAIDIERPRGESVHLAGYLDTLARVRLARGDAAEAEALERRALEIYGRFPDTDPAYVASVLDGVAEALRARGDREGAEAASRDAVAVGRTSRASRQADRGSHGARLVMLANTLYLKGDLAGADSLVHEAIAIHRAMQGARAARHLCPALRLLGHIDLAKGDVAGALAAYREAVALLRQLNDEVGVADHLTDVAHAALRAGDLALSEASLREALPILRGPKSGWAPARIANQMCLLAFLLQQKIDLAGAEAAYSEALELLRSAPDAAAADIALAHHGVGDVRLAKGDPAAAEAAYREALAIRRKAHGDGHPDVAYTLQALGEALLAKGDVAGAESTISGALAAARAAGSDALVGTALRSLARVAATKGDPAEAESRLREAVAICREKFGDVHCHLAATLVELARLRFAKDPVEAEAQRREAVSIYRKLEGDRSANVAMALLHLAHSLEARGDHAGNEACLREAAAIRQAALGPRHALTREIVLRLALALSARGDHAGAEAACVDALKTDRSDGVLAVLGMCLIAQDRHADAEAVLRECLELRAKAAPDAWPRWNAQSMLGESIAAQGRHAEAEPLLLEAYERMQPPGSAASRKSEALGRIVKLYEAWGKPEKAAEWRMRGGAGG